MDQDVTLGSKSCPHSASENQRGNESNLLSPNDVLPAIDLGRKSSWCPLTTRDHLASHPFCHHRQVSPLEKTQKHTKAATQTHPHTSKNTGHGLGASCPDVQHHQHSPKVFPKWVMTCPSAAAAFFARASCRILQKRCSCSKFCVLLPSYIYVRPPALCSQICQRY